MASLTITNDDIPSLEGKVAIVTGCYPNMLSCVNG